MCHSDTARLEMIVQTSGQAVDGQGKTGSGDRATSNADTTSSQTDRDAFLHVADAEPASGTSPSACASAHAIVEVEHGCG